MRASRAGLALAVIATLAVACGPDTDAEDDSSASQTGGDGAQTDEATDGGVDAGPYIPCSDDDACGDTAVCYQDQFPNPNGSVCAELCGEMLECEQVGDTVSECVLLGGTEGSSRCLVRCDDAADCLEGMFCHAATRACLWPG